MEEILYNSLTTYFKTISAHGYRNYSAVYKILVTDFLNDFIKEFNELLSDKDKILIQGLLYCFFETTCEIPLPTNCRCCCTEEIVKTPSLTNFSLIPTNTSYTGTQSISFTGAVVTISAGDKVLKENSLKIYWGSEIMKSDLPLENSIIFTPAIPKRLTVNNTYTARASVLDVDGEEYFSNIHTIKVNEIPTPSKEATLYYGMAHAGGSEGALAFRDKTAAQIMALNTAVSKVITGTGETTFIIHQTDDIHYLLIPTAEMELIHAEYGTVLVTTLWDKDKQSGAYKEPHNAGAYEGKQYTMWFLYNPGGGFSEDIRITVKNK